jgi:hypothetical protein
MDSLNNDSIDNLNISEKNSVKSNRSKTAPKLDSDEISMSQLELMANKKKLNKKSDEVSVSKIFTVKEPESAKESIQQKPEKSRRKRRQHHKSTDSSTSTRTEEKIKDKERHISRENKSDSVRKEKSELLYKFNKMNANGQWSSLRLDMNCSLDEIKNECERVRNEMQTERSVAFFKRMLLLGVQGIEMMNTKFDPLGVDLDGWSEAMGYSMENAEYDEVLAELYKKYKGRGTMSPEVKLIFMIISSATMFTITKKITKMDSGNGLKNFIGSVLGNHSASAGQPGSQQQYYGQQSNDQERNKYDSTEATDIYPSKLKGPSPPVNMLNNDGVDINQILQTMNERKREKEGPSADLDVDPVLESTDDILKSIPIVQKKRGRGRPKKNASLHL